MVASAAAITATNLAAEPLTDLLGSRSHWEEMVWETSEHSPIWAMSGWTPYQGKQDAGWNFTKVRPVTIDGKHLKANIIVEDTPKRRNILSITSIDLSSDECDEVGNWLVKRFGKPDVVVDGTYKQDLIAEGNWVQVIDRTKQWDIAATRATFRCGGVRTIQNEKRGEKDNIVTTLTFGGKEYEQELKPLFGLRCTQRIEFIGIARAPENLDDVVLIIDENRKRVRSATGIPIQGEHRITDDVIELKVTKENSTAAYSIDRHTGGFKTLIRGAMGGGANVTGRCEKIEPGQRKF